MGTRTVRLDEETERILARLQSEAGLSVSGALKRGLLALDEAVRSDIAGDPWSVYASLELGPARGRHATARHAKARVREALQRKHRR